MTVSDLSVYPDPDPAGLPTKVRSDGERVVGGWDVDKLHIEGNEGGKVRCVRLHVRQLGVDLTAQTSADSGPDSHHAPRLAAVHACYRSN
jgi:hypothetical protein